MVTVKWWGRACFEVRDKTTIVIDPHDGKSVKMQPPRVKGDLVIVSHGHADHAGGKDMVLKQGGQVIDQPGMFDEKGVKVTGVAGFHDETKGSQRGKNIAYAFEVDGIRFAHLGDLGHPLSDDDVKKLGRIDVLMIPVGGFYTIDAKTATSIIDKIKPCVAIPMHYKVPGGQDPISDVESFLAGKKNVNRLGKPETDYSKDRLPQPTRIDVFSPP
jgi:L-ascorbate metabolism protein UlaG (beta-lactamase superfamily)